MTGGLEVQEKIWKQSFYVFVGHSSTGRWLVVTSTMCKSKRENFFNFDHENIAAFAVCIEEEKELEESF